MILGLSRFEDPGDSALVLLNDGTGVFDGTFYQLIDFEGQASENRQANLNFVSGALLADYNQDGVVDLLYSTSVQNNGFDFNGVGIRLGTRPGEFGLSRTIPFSTSAIESQEPFVGDFNGDGNIDLLSVVNNPNIPTTRLGNGDGTFQDPIPAAEVGTFGPVSYTHLTLPTTPYV